ncbi:hypothetical protein D3C79_801670 [compost metagenome]
MAQGNIDRITMQVDQLGRGLHTHVDFRVLCIEIRQAWHKPTGRERGLGADRQCFSARQHFKVQQGAFDLAKTA